MQPYRYPHNPFGAIDPWGLQDIAGLIQSSFAGVADQVSLGMHMAQQGATPAQILEAMHRSAISYRAPVGLNGTLSVEANIGGHVMAGGNGSIGLAIGKNRHEFIPRVCAYITTCQTIGLGASGGGLG